MKELAKKWSIALILGGLTCLLTVMPAWGQDSPFKDTLALIDAFRTGGWLAVSIALVNLLTSLLKQARFLSWIPIRWRVAIPVLLGGLSGILSSVLGGLPPLEALWIGLFSGPGAVFAHEAVTEAVLGTSQRRHS